MRPNRHFDPRFTPELRVDATRSLSARGNGEIIDTDDGLQFFGDIADFEEQALLTTELKHPSGYQEYQSESTLLTAPSPFSFNVTQPLLRGVWSGCQRGPGRAGPAQGESKTSWLCETPPPKPSLRPLLITQL